jgi:hypothetical protein
MTLLLLCCRPALCGCATELPPPGPEQSYLPSIRTPAFPNDELANSPLISLATAWNVLDGALHVNKHVVNRRLVFPSDGSTFSQSVSFPRTPGPFVLRELRTGSEASRTMNERFFHQNVPLNNPESGKTRTCDAILTVDAVNFCQGSSVLTIIVHNWPAPINLRY